jgi:hypothetical protein
LEEPKQLGSLAPLTPSAFACTKEPIDIGIKPIISSITRTSKNERKRFGYKKLGLRRKGSKEDKSLSDSG